MIERFFPDEEISKVEEISVEYLKEKSIKGLILDIDNTISEWRARPTENVLAWIEMLKRNNIKLCLVSNNNRSRAEIFSKRLELNAIHGALKPRKKAFVSAMRLMNTKPTETAVVGDQIFTDIYGGNRLNLYTIYVNPISKKDTFFVYLKRPFEKYILNKFKKFKFIKNDKRLSWKERSGSKKLKTKEVSIKL